MAAWTLPAALAAGRGVDWDDCRRKVWHTLLILGAAYAATHPGWEWVLPVLTAAAGASAPPVGRLR